MMKIWEGALEDTRNKITREDPPATQEHKEYQDSNDTMTKSLEEDEEIKARQLTRYQVIVAWANEVTKALETLDITPKATRGLLITIITTGIVGLIITITLVTQVIRLTRRMRRVRKTLDLRMIKKKQAKKDKEGNEAMEERRKKSEPNPDNSYPANPERNRIEIRAIRAQINVWKKREEKHEDEEEKKQKEKEKLEMENAMSAI